MKTALSLFFGILLYSCALGQNKKDKVLAEISTGVCRCIDSISVFDKSKRDVSNEIKDCIDKSVGAYQITAKLLDIDSLKKNAPIKDGKTQINISINVDKNSRDYKNYYFEIERYLMENCGSLKEKIAANDKQNKHSLSENPEALKLYYQGIDEGKAGNFKKAIEYYKGALKIDSLFAFAWDNIGISYRKLEEYDQALYAYKKSLEIDPKGLMPLQNIAIVYQYKGEYQQAIEAYKKLSEVDSANAEVYYGIGQIYVVQLRDFENGLDNLCKAYNLYIENNSPHRTDAEKLIQFIYQEMKNAGKEAQFYEILKKNHITPEK